MSDRFDELVDHSSLSPEERARLRRVHDLLLEVGPPPEAPQRLRPPAEGLVIPFRRRTRGLLLIAAALALAAAGGAGYLLGDRATSEEATRTITATDATTVVETVTAAPEQPQGELVTMRGVGAASGASATVEILPRARTGDYPVRIRLRGLPERETFELWVYDDGELDQLCGSFTTEHGVTDTVIAVPYEMKARDDWVVVRPGTSEPLLQTA